MSEISIFHYFFIGIMIFQCIHMGISTILFRRKDTLYFFFFLIFSIINFVALNYRLFNLGHLHYATSSTFRLFFFPTTCISIGFYYWFILNFLEIESANKKLYWFFILNVILNFFFGILFGIFEYLNIRYINVFFVLGFLTYFVSFFSIYQFSKSQLTYSRIIIFGIIASTLGSFGGLIVVFIYGSKSPIESHLFSEIGVLIDVFIYSIALNKKWSDNEKNLLKKQLVGQILLANERQRIASEMHDELGGNLTSLMYLAHSLKTEVPQNQKVNTIIESSAEISDTIEEIIWALNQEQNTLEDWVKYVKGKIAEMIENSDLNYTFKIPEIIPEKTLSSNQKRNLYLVLKEAVNNVIKHAGAKNIEVSMDFEEQITIKIKDDGKGIQQNSEVKVGKGNGLKNMNQRIHEIGGKIDWIVTKGTEVSISLG
jgi:signal transduction histidine kinase